MSLPRWQLSWRADPQGAQIADRHYSRQKIGARQFVKPGRCVVLRTPEADALWVTSWPYPHLVKHAWAGAWECSLFRNESAHLSSDLIREAVAITRGIWPDVPVLGMVTFVAPSKVRRKRDPGRCYVKAGWTRLKEHTKEEQHVVLQLLPAEMPPPLILPRLQPHLLEAVS